jgi:hypothetical protein
MGWWGEDFFEMKNSFLLIKILPTSLPPAPPHLPTNQVLGLERNGPGIHPGKLLKMGLGEYPYFLGYLVYHRFILISVTLS